MIQEVFVIWLWPNMGNLHACLTRVFDQEQAAELPREAMSLGVPWGLAAITVKNTLLCVFQPSVHFTSPVSIAAGLVADISG